MQEVNERREEEEHKIGGRKTLFHRGEKQD